jgi:hypothetical protein
VKKFSEGDVSALDAVLAAEDLISDFVTGGDCVLVAACRRSLKKFEVVLLRPRQSPRLGFTEASFPPHAFEKAEQRETLILV